MKNTKLTALTTSLLLGLAATAFSSDAAAESSWTSQYTINRLELSTASGGGQWAWISLDSWSGAYNAGSEGCTNTYGFIITDANGGFDVLFRTFTAAYLAGRPVSLPTGGGERQRRLLPSNSRSRSLTRPAAGRRTEQTTYGAAAGAPRATVTARRQRIAHRRL